MSENNFLTEKLQRRHDKAAFSCGVAELDKWLHRQSGQDERADFTRVFVVLDEKDGKKILAFYSLSTISIDASHMPEKSQKKLPRYSEVPAVLLGRLAVSKDQQGKGLGKLLLLDALARLVSIKETLGYHAVIVDAKDQAASAFYQKYGFIELPDNANRLFLPLKTIASLF